MKPLTKQTLWLPEIFPGMNEILQAAKIMIKKGQRNPKNIAYAYTEIKRIHGERVYWEAKRQGIKPVSSAYFKFLWIEPDRMRDKDNIAVARKFIFDGLVQAGILINDGWNQVNNWDDKFKVDKENPGVMVEIFGD